MAEIILETEGDAPKWSCACCSPMFVQADREDRIGVLTRHITEPSRPAPWPPQVEPVQVHAVLASPLKDVASRTIDLLHDSLDGLSKEIWAHPETAYCEHRALRTLSDFIGDTARVQVSEQYLGLETSFRAEFGSGSPKVLICAEYDALPEIGHACGHNLIATAAVGAFLGLQRAMEEARSQDQLKGTVVILGTPAEEALGGKQELLNRGAFEGVDCAMMVHPAPFGGLYVPFLALNRALITFKGRSAHASASPWQGINALDAMLVAFHGISAARQQMKPTWRVHGVITKGGLKPNIIPDLTEAEFAIRAPNVKELGSLKEMVQRCFDAAAMATGCDLEVEWCGPQSSKLGHEYASMRHNSVMNELYRANVSSFGRSFRPRFEEASFPSGSTDMANVSHVVPTIHPMFAINTKFPNHHQGFTERAASPEAFEEALLAAKAMAMTALDMLTDENHLTAAKAEFSS